MAYVIKDNLPDCIIQPTGRFTRQNALRHFLGLVSHLSENGYWFKVCLRDEKEKPLRGTIQVEISGFYHYVELYKE